MPKKSFKTLIALLAIGTCSATSAAMYRWLDENGVTVYSQIPPPSGDAVELEKQPTPPAESVNAAHERSRRKREQEFDAAEARKETEAEEAKQAEEKKRLATNCAAARGNLEKFQNLGARRILTSDGRYLKLSEGEVETQIQKAQGQVDEYCR